jgi:hypothetical protein
MTKKTRELGIHLVALVIVVVLVLVYCLGSGL